jgi:hypothetical protein
MADEGGAACGTAAVIDGGAAMNGRCCCHGRLGLLPWMGGAATNGKRWCFMVVDGGAAGGSRPRSSMALPVVVNLH